MKKLLVALLFGASAAAHAGPLVGAAACAALDDELIVLQRELKDARALAEAAKASAATYAGTAALAIVQLDAAKALLDAALPFARMGTPAAAAQVHGYSYARIAPHLAAAHADAAVVAVWEKTPAAIASMRRLAEIRKLDIELDRTALECYISL